jgi:transposase
VSQARRAAARRGRRLRIMFADEARFGRMNRIRPCWAPVGTRPAVAAQLIREYIYLYGAVSPKDGTCVYLIMPTSNTASFQAFLQVLARRFARQDILLVLDGAPNHRCGDLSVPDNITLLYLPPYSPELNPKENLWDEIREKIFKNYALKSMDAVRAKLQRQREPLLLVSKRFTTSHLATRRFPAGCQSRSLGDPLWDTPADDPTERSDEYQTLIAPTH